MEQQEEVQSVARPHVKADQGCNQNQQCDARLRQFDQIGNAHAPARQFQRGYFHAGTLVGTIAYVRSDSRNEVPRISAPVSTCAVVGRTALAVQTVSAPSMSWMLRRTTIVKAGLNSSR